MKKKLFIIGGILVVLIGALLVAPNLIDWNSYKPQVASAVETATGKQVRFDGDLSFKLWPSPALSASDVSLPNIPGGKATNFLEMDALDIRLELFPLLSGNVKVTSLVVDGGRIYLERDLEGVANWNVLFASEEAEEPEEEGEVAINSFLLSETDVYYSDLEAGYSDQVTGINADLIITSLAGPFTGSGDLVYRDVDFDFSFATGLFSEGANIPLRLGLVPEGNDPGLNFQGTFVQEKGVAALSGSFKGGGSELSPLITLISSLAELEAPPKGPWDNKFELDTNLLLVMTLSKTDLVLDPLSLSLGKTEAKGSLQVLMTDSLEAKTTLSLNSLNANEWISEEGGDEPFELPADVKAQISLNVETLGYDGGTIQKVDFQGKLEDGTLAIENFAAVLPGNSDLRLTGNLSGKNGRMGLEAMVHLDARALRGLTDWLEVDLSEFPNNRVTRLTFDGRVRVNDPAVDISNATISLDSTRFKGGMKLNLEDQSRFDITGALTTLDLDTYYPELLQESEPMSLGEQIEALQESLKGLVGYNSQIDLKMDRVKMAGANILGITLKAGLSGNNIEISSFRADSFEGATVTLSGRITDIPGQMGYDLRGGLSSDTFKALMTWFAMESPFDERIVPQGTLNIRLNGVKTRTAYDFSGELTGIRFALKGSAENLLGTPVVSATLDLSHERTIEFIRKFSPDYFPAKTPIGPFSLKTSLKGDEGDFRFDNLVLQMGQARFSGNLRYQDIDGRVNYSGDISTGQLRLDDFMAPVEAGLTEVSEGGQRWSSDEWDTTFLKENDFNIGFSAESVAFRTYNFAKPNVRLIGTGGVLTIENLRAGFYGGTVLVNGKMDATGVPVLDLTMTMDNVSTRDLLTASADIDKLTGRVDFTGQFKARGQSQEAMIRSLSGTGNLSSSTGVIRGINMKNLSQKLGTLNSVQALGGLVGATFRGGETPYRFIRTDAKVNAGVISFDQIESDVDAVDVGGRGRINLPAWNMDISGAMRLKDYPDAPAIGFNMRGRVDAPEVKYDYAAFTNHLTTQLTDALFQNLLGGKKPAEGSGPAVPGPAEGGATEEEAEPTPEEQLLEGIFDLLGGDEEEEETEEEGGGN